MKIVIWKDKHGYKHRSLLRDTDRDDQAAYGVPQDPPDLNQIDWEEVKKEIHNHLVEKGLIT
jgi:hypothetical protein